MSRTKLHMDNAEIEALADRALRGELRDADGEHIHRLLHVVLDVARQLQEKNASIRRLRQLDFGFRSERRSSDRHRTTDDQTKSTARRPPGHGRRAAVDYPGAQFVRAEHTDLARGSACPGGCGGRLYELSRPLVSIHLTGSLPVHATRLERAVLRCSTCQATVAAPHPPDVPEAKFDPSADAAIALMRYGSGMPFYRLARLQAHAGVPLPRSVQWERAETLADAALPVYQLLLGKAARAGLLHADDTTARILSLMAENKTLNEGERRAIYTTGVVASPVVGDEGHRVALYFSGRKHGGENVADLLDRRPDALEAPIRMADASASNRVGEVTAVEAGCWAHARRNFVEAEEHFPYECKHVLEAIGFVYGVDAEAREKKLGPGERLVLHQRQSRPVLEALRTWMRERLEHRLIEEHSSLGRAMRYVERHWSLLARFLEEPGIPLDNNPAERSLRRSVLHRRNSLFFRNEHGAAVGDILASLIESCALNDANPLEYLTAIGRYARAVRGDPAAWLPWTYCETVAAGTVAPCSDHGVMRRQASGKRASSGLPL